MGPAIRKRKNTSLGKTFGESLEQQSSYHFSRGNSTGISTKLKAFVVSTLVIAGFCLLMTRLFYLTIVDGVYYQNLSESNRIREERLQPPRGVIYSRDGEVLAGNRPIYKQCNLVETDGVFKKECHILSREMGIEKESQNESVIVELGREYNKSIITAHTVGYMQEVDSETLQKQNEKFDTKDDVFCQECYGLGDFIGVSGLEESFEAELRGIPGKRLVEVGADEKPIKELAKVLPVPGKNIHTSLDLPLQEKAVAAVQKVRSDPKIPSIGASVIATDPKTGEVLALYSDPTFDPNSFVAQDKAETPDVDEIFTNPEMPLFNRVLSGLYPPASTFKIITTAAGLEEGALTAATTVEDTGVISIGPFSFANWYFTQYGSREGNIDIVQALARSNDIFFYKVGEWLGIDKLDKWGKIFKTDQHLGIEIEGEVPGLIRRDRTWYLGDTYHASIGQGDVLATPLHVNTWTQIIANRGTYCRPTLLKKDLVSDGKSFVPDPINCEDIEIKEETLDLITEGMKRACSTGGTAYPLFNFSVNTATSSASTREFVADGQNYSALENGGTSISVACKTGTAETSSPEDNTHAWLTAFAPSENPEIVVTVLIEEGGEGSSVAAPIVKEMLQEWFSRDR